MIEENLRKFFRERKITQQDIADRLQVTQGAVNSLLSGRRNFGAKTAQDWHDAFGFRVNWLRTGEGPMMDTDINSLPSPEQLVSELVASGAIVVEDKDVKEQMYESMIRERDEKIRQLEQEIFLLKNKMFKIG